MHAAPTKHETIHHHAERFGVDPRTIYRWLRDGVNLEDACEVATYLAGQKTPSPEAVAAVRLLLQTELNNLSQ
jgi:hypothetical protein